MVKGDLRGRAPGARRGARDRSGARRRARGAGADLPREGEWDRLVNGLQSMADATLDVVLRSMVRHTLGLIQDVMLHNPSAARAAYKLALVDDPANLAAAVSLQSLALLQEDWVELARVLVLEAELVGDARSVRRLCERAGDLYWERLGDAESAIAAYRRPRAPRPTRSRRCASWRRCSSRWAAGASWSRSTSSSCRWCAIPRSAAICSSASARCTSRNLGRTARTRSAAWQQALEAVPTHHADAAGARARCIARASAGPSWCRWICARRRRSPIRGGAPSATSRSRSSSSGASAIRTRRCGCTSARSICTRPPRRVRVARSARIGAKSAGAIWCSLYERQARRPPMTRSWCASTSWRGGAAVARSRAQRRQGAGGLPRRAGHRRAGSRRRSSCSRRARELAEVGAAGGGARAAGRRDCATRRDLIGTLHRLARVLEARAGTGRARAGGARAGARAGAGERDARCARSGGCTSARGAGRR